MQPISFDRSNVPQAALVALVTVAAVAVLGFVLAYWAWVWFAPRAEPRAPMVAHSTSGEAAASLFGTAPKQPSGPAPGRSSVKLLGVVAATPGRRGYAVVQLDAGEIAAVPEGEEVSTGVRLAEVAPDHVILERGAARETVTWPEKGAPPIAPVAPLRPSR